MGWSGGVGGVVWGYWSSGVGWSGGIGAVVWGGLGLLGGGGGGAVFEGWYGDRVSSVSTVDL